jgi:hypothetical protein
LTDEDFADGSDRILLRVPQIPDMGRTERASSEGK